jgi:hypothetical protein
MSKSNKDQTSKKKKEPPKRKRKSGSPHEKDHDALAKVGFSDIKGVQGLLKAELPDDLQAVLDLTTLQRISDSYTDERLKGTFSDKAFTCKSLLDETVVIAFICEHKSYIPSEPIYIQLLQYKINHWRETALEGLEIACIIPIVIYHGEKDWDIQPFHTYFNLKTNVFNRFIPQFDIVFINLKSMPEERIIANPLLGKLRAVLMALKYSHYPNILLQYFNLILTFVVDSNGNTTEVEIRFANAVIEYILRRTPMTEEEYLEKIDYLNHNLKDMATSTYDNIFRNAYKRARVELLDETRAEVRAEVQATIQATIQATVQATVQAKSEVFVTNLLLEFEFDDDKIANLANVSLEFVKEIRKKIAEKQ